MPTALALQLAQIRACSTNPLDLKAQKKAHSRSLLFEPRIAAIQDFETLYQICLEGFQDLCHLDGRFSEFADSIFSEQSKHEDRTQMTAAQNQRLDAILEAFLNLVGGKLLFKPALKAVEWLVRRFRIHQNNTLCMVFAFLPFHSTPIFLNILSLIPENILPSLRFLYPYTQSLVNPPRHAVIHAACTSRPFFVALSAYVLKCCQLGLQHPTLVSFWASITAEAVAAMLDRSRSARLESREQNKEDVVLLLLPILNAGLSLDNVPDLRVGCYMILSILASKASLDDSVLSVMMEAITSEWDQTANAGLICLGVLADQKRTAGLPRKTFEAVVALERLDDDLMEISKHYDIDRFVLGIALGIVSRLDKARDTSELRLLRVLLEANVMSDVSTRAVVQSVISVFQTPTPDLGINVNVQGSLADLVLRLSEPESLGAIVRSVIEESNFDLGILNRRLRNQTYSKGSTPEQRTEHVDRNEAHEQLTTNDFEAVASRIPTRTAYEISFLSHSDSYVYGSLARAFLSIHTSTINVEKFSDLPVLRKSLGMSEPFFLSFFIRIWCSHYSAKARTAAMQTVLKYFRNEALAADVQALLPYLLYALADTSSSVRHSAADIVLVLAPAYEKMADQGGKDANQSILGQQQIYGQGGETQAVIWLSNKEAARIVSSLIVPALEECMLDETYISRLLSDCLNGPKKSRGTNTVQKGLKKTLRLTFFTSICSHVVSTPLYAVKFRLLEMLYQVPRVGSTSRTKLLLPLLSDTMKTSQQAYERICKEEQLDPSQMLDRIVSVVVPNDREGLQTLNSIIELPDNLSFPSLKAAALRRLQTIWTSINIDLQSTLAETLFESAVGNIESETNEDCRAEAMETLRSLPLSTSILRSFLENLPSISSTSEDRMPASKRRRITHGHPSANRALDKSNFAFTVRRVTFVLELIAGHETGQHSELLGSLFLLMCDLQQSQGHLVTAIDYLQILAIECMLPIVKRAEIDDASIRSDVLIDCIRTTTNPQVRNSALLLVSALAEVTPESILHSIMPVFTFMGANVLRQDDEFSAYVVKQTMESVIPRLVYSLHKRKDGPLVGLSELLLSFVAAYEHVPAQRRVELYVSLANKVGPDDHLFALIAMLLDKYPSNRSVVHFATDLTSRYSLKTRVKTVKQLLDLIIDAGKQNPTLSKTLLQLDDVDGAIINLLTLAPAILGDVSLVSKVSRRLRDGGEDAANVCALCTRILEATFMLSSHYTGNEKFHVPCMQLVDASLRLLPVSQLIEALQSLLARTEDNIRQQALRSFRQYLTDDNLDLEASQTGCLAFLPSLASMITHSSDVSLKKMSILCIASIAEKFGKKNAAAVITSARTVAEDKCWNANDRNLRTISMQCLATVVEVTSDSFVSILPLALPKVMDSLATSMREGSEYDQLHNAAYLFLSSLLLHVPWMITGTDLALVLKLSFESANAAEMGGDRAQNRIGALRLMPTKLEAKDCLAALDRTWTDAMTEGPQAIKEHLEILRLLIERQPKSVISHHSEALGGLFLKIFDLRREKLSAITGHSYDIAEIRLIEGNAIHSAILMVYKLNDIKFRPMFSRMSEWTTFPTLERGTEAKIRRQTTWYMFLLELFSSFKSVVTHYAALILDDAVKILKHTSLDDGESLNLWQQVILTLQKTFENDQDDFYESPSHFAPIMAALVGQLDKAPKISLLPELIPAITELAVATDSATYHKEMNAVILKNMRSDKAAVRLAAVQTQRDLTERLGEVWLAFLPEILPFINEALEDDDEAVEKEVQMWVAKIEAILGESLDTMLQ